MVKEHKATNKIWQPLRLFLSKLGQLLETPLPSLALPVVQSSG